MNADQSLNFVQNIFEGIQKIFENMDHNYFAYDWLINLLPHKLK